MARSRRPPDGPSLFDLPLHSPEAEAEEGATRAPEPAAPAPRKEIPPLFPDPPPDEPVAPSRPTPPRPTPPRPSPAPRTHPAEVELDLQAEASPRAPTPRPAALGDRLRAGLADLAVHAAVTLTALVGAELLGARPGFGDLLPLLAFLAIFSFAYSVIPLAFWGQTPGMIWAGLVCRSDDGQALTFGETVRRWLGGLLTALLLGVPALFALGDGRSLADRLSGSRTWSLA